MWAAKPRRRANNTSNWSIYQIADLIPECRGGQFGPTSMKISTIGIEAGGKQAPTLENVIKYYDEYEKRFLDIASYNL